MFINVFIKHVILYAMMQFLSFFFFTLKYLIIHGYFDEIDKSQAYK